MEYHGADVYGALHAPTRLWSPDAEGSRSAYDSAGLAATSAPPSPRSPIRLWSLVPTVYTFGTEAALLDESLGAAIVGFDRWGKPPADAQIDETPGLARVVAWIRVSSHVAHRLRHLLHPRGRGVLERVAGLTAVRGFCADAGGAAHPLGARARG